MPSRSLNRAEREPVTLLTRGEGPPNDLGERGEVWTPGEVVSALVIPLSLVEVERAGLTVGVEALTVYAPPRLVTLPGRVRLRDRDWEVKAAAHWPSRTVLTVQEAPP